jgi:hypothetical protein
VSYVICHCHRIIGVVSVVSLYNCVYYFDTCYINTYTHTHIHLSAARGACVTYELLMMPDPNNTELSVLNMRMSVPIILGNATSAPKVVGAIFGVIPMDVVLDSLVPEFLSDLVSFYSYIILYNVLYIMYYI